MHSPTGCDPGPRVAVYDGAMDFPAELDDLALAFPPLGLRILAGDLELRLLRDSDLPAYAELLRAPVFADPELTFPWWGEDAEQRVRDALRFQWGKRANLRPEAWELAFGLFRAGELIGMQSLIAHDFAVRRTVTSGSWLARAEQGRGIGTRMRQMVLAFAFDHLGAARAETSALAINAASIGVSRACGYADNGTEVVAEDGRPREMRRFVLERADFPRPETRIEVEGLSEELRGMLGAGDEALSALTSWPL